MYGLKNGTLQNVPQTAILSTGETAIGYDNLIARDQTIAEQEGWSDLKDGVVPIQEIQVEPQQEKSEFEIMKETLDALVLASLEG